MKMYLLIPFLVSVFFLSSCENLSQKAANNTLTSNETAQFDKIVAQYLAEHPALLKKIWRDQYGGMSTQQSQKLTQSVRQLFSEQMTPALGNPSADVTIAVFYDYGLASRRDLKSTVEKLTSSKKARVLLLPMSLSHTSQAATYVALQAAKQGRFEQVHHALLKLPAQPSSAQLKALIVRYRLDLDLAQVPEALMKESQDIILFAPRLQVQRLPTYVIGDSKAGSALYPQVVSGPTNYYHLQAMVKKYTLAQDKKA